MSDKFRVIIAGGREFDDYKLLNRKCSRILSKVSKDIIIRSGGARGADKLGEQFRK